VGISLFVGARSEVIAEDKVSLEIEVKIRGNT
jgi:hypothetical protein